MKLYILSILLVFVSCTKEEFTANTISQTGSTDPIWHESNTLCADFTLVKPKVDFIFIWDNSSSQIFVTPETKEALNNTIENISTRFDYRILITPLISEDNSSNILIADNSEGLTSEATAILKPASSASQYLNFPFSAGIEHGLDRANDLLETNQTNGILRKNAYTVIVLMSNGDDIVKTETSRIDMVSTEAYIEQEKIRMLNIKNTQLMSSQLRFMSIVAHSACEGAYGTFQQNYSYKTMSQKIFAENTGIDSMGSSTPDSFDICGADFSHLFDGVNNSIQNSIEAHVYKYWPIASAGSKTFNKDKLVVKKSTGTEIFPKTESSSNGYTVLDGVQTVNTRELPTAGEPYTGYVLELFGDSKVTYPECLIVQTEAAVEFYGYIQLHSKPLLESLRVKINGIEIFADKTNGYEYIGYKENLSIRIDESLLVDESGNYVPSEVPDYKNGYFLKLYGSAIYSNGAQIEVVYDPSAD